MSFSGRRFPLPRRMLSMWRHRIQRGQFAILLFGKGPTIHSVYKLNQADIIRLEQAKGRKAEELPEEELLAVMLRFGIKKMELDAADQEAVNRAPDEPLK